MVTPVLGTLGYILSHDKTQVLMIHRNKRLDDAHYGKYNGLGGKMEPEESIIDGMRREILEESGITADKMTLRGTISWTGFGKNNEDWFGFIFLITDWHGEPLTENHEGTLEWVNIDDISKLPMWPGDKYFLPLVFDDDPHPFHGAMPYHNGEMVSWHYER